jgi:hypothetical protein
LEEGTLMNSSDGLEALEARFHGAHRERTAQIAGPLKECIAGFFDVRARSETCVSCGSYFAGFANYVRGVRDDTAVFSVLGTFARDWLNVFEDYFVAQVGSDSFGLTAVELFRWPNRCMSTETITYDAFLDAIVVDAVASALLAVEIDDLTAPRSPR